MLANQAQKIDELVVIAEFVRFVDGFLLARHSYEQFWNQVQARHHREVSLALARRL